MAYLVRGMTLDAELAILCNPSNPSIGSHGQLPRRRASSKAPQLSSAEERYHRCHPTMPRLATGIRQIRPSLQNCLLPKDTGWKSLPQCTVKRPKMSPFRPLLKCYRQSTHLCGGKKLSVASIGSDSCPAQSSLVDPKLRWS